MRWEYWLTKEMISLWYGFPGCGSRSIGGFGSMWGIVRWFRVGCPGSRWGGRRGWGSSCDCNIRWWIRSDGVYRLHFSRRYHWGLRLWCFSSGMWYRSILLLFLINYSDFFSCSMILWSSLSLASFSYYLLRSSNSFSILLRLRFILKIESPSKVCWEDITRIIDVFAKVWEQVKIVKP